MTPLVMPPFQQPDAPSTAAFVVVMGVVLVLVAVGIVRGGPEGEAAAVRTRWVLTTVVAVVGWLALTGGFVLSGAVRFAPGVAGYVGGSLVTATAVAVSPVGARLARNPVAWLIGFQAFRLPLELILHDWVAQGTLPVQMTWSGQNLDIAAGVLASVLGAAGLRWTLPLAVVWAFQGVGSLLLLNVMRIAITSAPLPTRTFLDDLPVMLPFFLPYSWIVSVLVAGAWLGHLVLFRKLLSR